ncbi:MAG: TonB-dependent siderophore receptor [Acidimicrobiia bacterium]|nr:TonB-dependent siderophore receptor [Acidimicrobiia bacterium]
MTNAAWGKGAVLAWMIVLAVSAATTYAQAPAARTVSGLVVDSMGGVVTGASVVARTSAGERTTVTTATGTFAFDQLPAGAATLTVSFDGFATRTITVDVGRTDVRVVLSPGNVVEEVTVRAPATTALRTRTATRTDTPLRDVPQAVTVISRDLIADQTMSSMADVVNYVPGVGMAQGEGHRDAPIFRGNTSTSDFFVDGIRDDTQYLRDLYNVERVEVLKGPNGMVFGRGGVGGVINRVTRQADWMPAREVVVQGGSWEHRRVAADLGHAFSSTIAARLTGVFEGSETYRGGGHLDRYGLNPTVAFAIGPRTTLRAGYEFFHDERTNDRGVPSFAGRPLDVDRETVFGNIDANESRLTLNAGSASVEHRVSDRFTLRNHLRVADYDKYYQNTVPGGVNAARTTFALTAYNSGTDRRNVFNQTDLTFTAATGRIEHQLLAGVEVARQVTDNLRLTGFFPSVGAAATSVTLPIANPTTSLPVEFRSSAREQDNHGVATAAGVYAQDQIALSRHVQAIVGVRYDRFDVDFIDNRNGAQFASTDDLVSPRVALVFKPVTPVSLYASYSRSYLPRAGEQLSSLSLGTQALEPEVFRNREIGAKWEMAPALSLTAVVYRLDHGNVVVRDAVNPTLSHLVDAERTSGLELELSGSLSSRWTMLGGYAYQDGEITRSLSAAVVAGARLAQVPRHSFSIWNKYDVSRVWGVGLGVISQSDRFVATDNLVVLPAYARVDAAVFATINPRLRLHVNVENLFDEHYFWAAHNNNNIAPGSPRGVRAALTTRF